MRYFIIALSILMVTALAAPAAACDKPKDNFKVYVCKYVGTPGEDERLQTGQNPIEVSVNAIKDYQGVGSWFNDAQGRSYVLGVVPMDPEPSVKDCPGYEPPPPPEPPAPPKPPVPPTPEQPRAPEQPRDVGGSPNIELYRPSASFDRICGDPAAFIRLNNSQSTMWVRFKVIFVAPDGERIVKFKRVRPGHEKVIVVRVKGGQLIRVRGQNLELLAKTRAYSSSERCDFR